MGSASTKYFLLIFGYVLSFFRAEKGARGLLRILYIADGAKTAKARRKNPSPSVGAARGATEYEGTDTGETPFYKKGVSPDPFPKNFQTEWYFRKLFYRITAELDSTPAGASPLRGLGVKPQHMMLPA